MSVQFILGRSGTGKTSFCIRAVVDALQRGGGGSVILLVPEQATYQAERAILSDKNVAGYSSAGDFCDKTKSKKGEFSGCRSSTLKPEPLLNVLSFERLQFLLMGRHRALPVLSNIGRQLLIHRILRENSSELKLFGSSAGHPGLGRQMADIIAELHRYAKTPDDVDRLTSQLQKDEANNPTALKFHDIGLVFKEYLRYIEGKFIDPDFELTRAREAVADASFVKGARLWVDGFAGFTAGELAILAELLKAVSEAHIALCLDASNIDLTNPQAFGQDCVSLFSPTERTYGQLVELIKNCKLQLADPVILDRTLRFSGCRQLAELERKIFGAAGCVKSSGNNSDRSQRRKISAAGAIRIISAPSARAEVRFVARQILELVKQKGYRYRDIAVIASDISRYEHYIRAYFRDYGIPVFIDKRKPLSGHPVVQLICAALRTVTAGFRHSDIFSYLKTDVVPVERFEADLLENYCLAFGVNEADWQSDKDWQFAGKNDERFDDRVVNEIRLRVSGPLFELGQEFCIAGGPAKKIAAEKFVQIVFDFLAGISVRRTIGHWIEEALNAGDYAAADEHRQLYAKLVDIFDELVEVFAGRPMVLEDYVAILNCAFSQMTMAFIPASLDQVLIGSIERSRHPDLRAVFLTGATQKQFPVPLSFEGILTDDDRRAAEAHQFSLAPTVSQSLVERQYLAYIAFTRPSEALFITYPSTDDKGSGIERSPFVAELELLFEDLKEESIADERIPVQQIHTETELADLLCSRLGTDSALCQTDEKQALGELLDEIRSDKQITKLGETVVSAINYDNRAKLDKKVVAELFGHQIRSSATRLSTFAACPYRHFARYILELKEREEFKFEPLDVGNFYHRVLEALLKKLNVSGKDFASIEKEKLIELLREQISQIVQTDSFISNFRRHSCYNAYIIKSAGEVLEDCVLAIAQMVRAGTFRPSRCEVGFGKVKGTDESLGEYQLELSDERLLFLDGKIDRLDVADVKGDKAAIVFDYKKSKSSGSFSWVNFCHGLDMQLPIYMLAVRNAAASETRNIIGAFYIPVEVNPEQASLDELPEKPQGLEYKAKGIFNGEYSRQLDEKTISGESDFYNFYITKDGEPYGHYGNRGALKSDDFENFLKYSEKKIIYLAEGILSGRIDVKPYRLNQQSACIYCKYKSVCRFDWQINNYTYLEPVNKTKFFEWIRAADGREKD